MKAVTIENPKTIMKFIDYLVRMQKRYKELYLVGESYDENDNKYNENYACMSHTQPASWVWHYALSREHGTELSFRSEADETIANIRIFQNITTLEIPDNMWDDYDWRI